VRGLVIQLWTGMGLGLGCRADPGVVDSGPPPPTDLLAALEVRGIDVAEGRLRWDLDIGCCARGDCRLANPGAVYGFPTLPPGDDEYVGDRQPDADGHIAAWRLRPDEGVLYIGPAVPGVTYASFRSYVHDREGPGGARELASTNLGDTLNDRVFDANPDGTRVVLTTGHRDLAEAVFDAAAAVGWSEVGLDVLPHDLVRFGRDRAADTLRVTVRGVGLTDPAAFERYRDAGEGRVFRLTPAIPADPAPLEPGALRQAAPAPPLDRRAAVDALRQALLDRHPGWDVLETELTALQPPPGGAEGEPRCWPGCNRDLSYETTPGTPVGPGERIWVYGVDPAPLGRSTWTEIMLAGQRESDAAGHAGTDDLRGSARAIDPSADDELFAWAFARDCAGLEPFCSELGAECPGLAPTELGSVLVRHYLDPITGTFPPLEGLSERRAMKLTPPGDPR